ASVDVTANPNTAARYRHLKLPAVVTMEKKIFGMREKSHGESLRPADVRAHIAFLLDQGEDPAEIAARKLANTQQKATEDATKDVSAKTFKREVLKSKIPVMVDFWAPWCGPCQQVSPIVESLGEEYRGRVRVVKVNVDDNESLSRKYNIASIPTVMVFHQGAVVQTTHGAQPRRNYQRMLEQALADE
ncbi:MAG: thioredoxin, partial [Chloroflexota bacterium]